MPQSHKSMRSPRLASLIKLVDANLAMTAMIFLLAGCKVEPSKPPLVQTIAILPFDNESNDINAADTMQRLTYLALKPSAYQVMDIEVVNKKLADVGIVDGGQLPALDPTKMGKDFGVQALLYGSVASFDYTNIGYFLQRKVTLDLKLVDVGTGQTLWEKSGTGATRQVHLDPQEAKQSLAKGLADQLADKMFKTPLEEEARLATLQALRSLPGFSFTGFAQDDKTPNGIKRGSKSIIKGIINK